MSKATVHVSIGLVDLNSVGQGAFAGMMAGILAGAVSRVSMRLIAISGNMTPSFSIGGTLAILLIGATLGIPFGVIYMGLRGYLPFPAKWKGAVYGLLLAAIFVALPFSLIREGELSLVAPWVGVAIFAPVPLVFGIVVAGFSQKRGAKAVTDPERRVSAAWFGLFSLAVILAFSSAVTLIGYRGPYPPFFSALTQFGLRFSHLQILHGAASAAITVAYLGMAISIFWRGAESPMARLAALTLLFFAAANFRASELFGNVMNTLPVIRILPSLLKAASLAALIVLLFTFPDGRFVPRWTRGAAAIWSAWLFLWAVNPFLDHRLIPERWPESLLWVATSAAFIAGAFAQISRYRNGDADFRRKMRPVALGIPLAVLVFITLYGAATLFPALRTPGWQGAGLTTPFRFGFYLLPWLSIAANMRMTMARNRLLPEEPD